MFYKQVVPKAVSYDVAVKSCIQDGGQLPVLNEDGMDLDLKRVLTCPYCYINLIARYSFFYRGRHIPSWNVLPRKFTTKIFKREDSTNVKL